MEEEEEEEEEEVDASAMVFSVRNLHLWSNIYGWYMGIWLVQEYPWHQVWDSLYQFAGM